jgi:hypothetical protein
MLYVYGVVGGSRGIPVAEGVAGATTRNIRHRDLGAVVSPVAERRFELGEEAMWAHEAVVEQLMARGPVLPMRFGTALADDEAVVELLSSRRDGFLEALDRVRGAVEVGVRAIVDGDPEARGPAETPRSGSDYLLGRLQERRVADELARRVHEPLAALARESTLRVAYDDHIRVRASYLVDASRIDRLRARVGELERDGVASVISCTGPWPPYSFVEARSAA